MLLLISDMLVFLQKKAETEDFIENPNFRRK